jgi:xylan 1,4-beta-xylosidase
MPEFRYRNPITRAPSLALRDHFILRDNGRWLLTGTSLPVWTGPNPGVRLLVSDDLLHWTHHSWLIDATALPPGCFYNGRFWAPEIHRAHSRFWLTVNSGHAGPEHGERRMDGHGIVLFNADAITGPYRLVTTEGPIGPGFKNDASLFTDDDSRSYLYASGGGLWQSPIDLPTGTLCGDGGTWQKILAPRDPGNPDWMIGGIEGPFVVKRAGEYWMFFSAWTRGYEIGVLRASTPLGPWTLTPNSPILGTRKRRYRQKQMEDGGYAHLSFADTADPFVEVGHCAIFAGPGERDWLCCHYFLEGKEPVADSIIPEYHDTQPQLGIEPLRFQDGLWSVDGPTWTPQRLTW